MLAAVAAAAVLAAALFAPLTLLLFAAFCTVSRITRWRPAWLLVPACCGALWLLAIGAGAGVAAFARGTGSAGALLARVAADPPTLTGLPGAEAHVMAAQFPAALILAASAAALAWWVRWLHTDEWDLPAARPGLASLCRQRLTAASIRSGGVLTRDGACLGIDRVTGKPAAVSWRAASGGGVLVTGAAQPAVLASGWQLTHAAIRRRKPVIVVDLAGHRELPGMLAAVCAAAAAPLQVFRADGAVRYAPGHGPAEQDLAALRASLLGRWLGPGPAAAARISLDEVVRRRAVVLFALDQRRYGRAAEVIANLVAADVAEVYAALGGDGIAPEGLAWFTECAGADPAALGRLTGPGRQAGLAAVLTTIAPGPAAALAGQVDAAVIHRLADRELAARLAALTGTRLVPVSRVPAQAEDTGAAAPEGSAGPAVPFGTMPFPVVPADALCRLGNDEFVLLTGLAAAPVTVLARCQAITGRIPAQPRAGYDPPARARPPSARARPPSARVRPAPGRPVPGPPAPGRPVPGPPAPGRPA
jgi:hypothetical protein